MGEGDLVNFHPAKKSRVSSSCINSFFFFFFFFFVFFCFGCISAV